MNVLTLFGALSLDTKDYEKGLDNAKSKTSTFATSLKKGLSTAAKVGAASVAAVGTAVVGMTKSLVSATGELAEYGDAIDKGSQKIGISAQAYQEWDAILQHSGSSIDVLKPSLKTLVNAVENGSDAFEKLGLSQEYVQSLSQEELFSVVISQLQGMEEGTERTALATDLLGKGAVELGALLNTSAEDTEAMRKRLHELNGVMSDESVKAAAAYQDSLQDMRTAMSGAKRTITSSFLPSITTIMNGLTDVFAGNNSGVDLIGEGIGMMVDQVSSAMPQIMQLATTILSSLMNALTANLPQLLTLATNMVITLGQGLIQNLPLILDAGMQMLDVLITGIIENLPLIISAVLQIITALSNALLQYMPDIIKAGIIVLTGLLTGITEALPDMIPVIINMLLMLVDVLVENVPILIDAMIQIVTVLMEHLPEILAGLWQVIVKVWDSWVVPALEAVGGFFSGIWQSIKDIFSGVGRWFNEKVIQPVVGFFSGLWDGVKKGASKAWEGIKNVFKVVADWFTGIFKRAWEGVKNVFSTGGKIFSGIVDGISSVFKTVVNAIITGINKVVAVPFDTINWVLGKLKGLNILGIQPFGWIQLLNVPQIPQIMAQGGVLKRGQVGLLEGNGAEAVVPLEKNKEWIHAVAQDFAGEMGTTVTINVYGAAGQDVNELADIISRKINDVIARDKRVFA